MYRILWQRTLKVTTGRMMNDFTQNQMRCSKGIKFLTKDPRGFQVDALTFYLYTSVCFVFFLAEKQQHQQNLTELQVFIKFKEFIFQKAFCPLADINYPFPSPLESFNSGSLCINAYCSRTKIRQKMWNVLSQLHFYEDSAELCMYHFCKAQSPPGTLHAIML